jgi:hypothetical protein
VQRILSFRLGELALLFALRSLRFKSPGYTKPSIGEGHFQNSTVFWIGYFKKTTKLVQTW